MPTEAEILKGVCQSWSSSNSDIRNRLVSDRVLGQVLTAYDKAPPYTENIFEAKKVQEHMESNGWKFDIKRSVRSSLVSVKITNLSTQKSLQQEHMPESKALCLISLKAAAGGI